MTPLVQPPNQAGQMTAVMRALRPSRGSKVLRVAWVSRGRLMEERILAHGAALTVGPNEKSTFIVSAPIAARAIRLIEPTSRGYVLNVTAGMTGQVATEGRVLDLATASPGEGGAAQIPLGDAGRGKIAIGDALILFQVTDPPIAQAKAELPITVRSGLMDSLDWKTTFIAAFSFLFHFGAIGAIYSDFTDSIVDDDVTVSQAIDMIHDLPRPAIEMHDQDKPVTDAAPSAAPSPDHASRTATPSSGRSGPIGNTGGSPGRMTDVTATRIAGELREMDGLMLMGLNAPGSGRAIDNVLRDGNAPMGMLENLARSDRGVGPGDPAGLHMEGGGGVVKPGSRSGGLPGDVVASTVPTGTGRILEPKKPPSAITNIGGTTVGGGGTVANAAAVIASLRGGFRACYKRGLDEDPTMHGRVQLTAKIGPNGEVTSAQASGSGLSATVQSCLANKLRSAQFDAPSTGGATLIVPIVMDVQE